MAFEPSIPPIAPEYDAQSLEAEIQTIKHDLYLLRLFLEPAIHNTQNTPQTVLDDLQ